MAIQVTILSGAVGGLAATIIMTIIMMGLQRARSGSSPLPTAVFWAQFIGDGEPEDFRITGMILHLLYGTIAGIVFVAITSPLYLGLLTFDTLTMGVAWSIVYAIVLFVFGAVFWMMSILDTEPDRQTISMFLVYHLVYGIALGVWDASHPG